MKSNKSKRVLIIGAGPVGIAAAAHLLSRGINPIVLEKGYFVGSAMSEWGHVRLFSPWKYLIDKEVCKLLENHGWQAPDSEELPTGQEIVDQYLKPAADTQELKTSIILGAEVTGVSKQGHAKSSSKDRDDAAFTIHYKLTENKVNIISADSVIDTSGTWYNPNPIGLDGLAVPGEVENKNNIVYGIPDVITKDRADYEGKRVLVLGGGHSAINVALELLKIQSSNPDTRIVWGLRSNNLEKLIGGGINDELPARGKLGIAAKSAVEAGLLDLLAPFEVRRISKLDSGLIVNALVDGKEEAFELDRIIVAAGFRPDLNIHRELRLDVDDIVEAPTQLAPLIDPNLHSCGTVSPHGVRELTHHDKNFYYSGYESLWSCANIFDAYRL